MAKNQFDFDNIKKAANDIKEDIKQVNQKLTDLSESVIQETVKTGEAWQDLLKKAIEESKPLFKKQSEILADTAKGMQAEATYGFERFEKLSGYDFSGIRKSIKTETKRFKDGFEYITDQTEEILTEVSKRGDQIAETVADTAKSFAKEAEGIKDQAETKIKEVIKVVENRISDITPSTNPSKKTKTVKKKAAKKTATAKKTTSAKKAATTKKVATSKKAVTAKTSVKSTKPAAKKVSGASDNLKVIEGVGPKLESILNAAGYNSYADLAAAKVEDLKTVLAAAGSRYKMHNPTTWAKQASMAQSGDFDGLKKWQEANDARKSK